MGDIVAKDVAVQNMPRIRITESKVNKKNIYGAFNSPARANAMKNMGPALEPKYFEGASAQNKFDKHS